MKLEKAREIRGWMSEHELHWLGLQAEYSHHIMEVGCAYGRSTRALADNTSPYSFIYAVDTWNGSPDEVNTNHKNYKDLNGDYAFVEFCENLWAPIIVGTVVPLRMHSWNAAELFQRRNRKMDFIFIDADHTKQGLKFDILYLLPLLDEGGVLAGHDYNNINFPGVKEAVDEVLPNRKLAPLTDIWYIEK